MRMINDTQMTQVIDRLNGIWPTSPFRDKSYGSNTQKEYQKAIRPLDFTALNSALELLRKDESIKFFPTIAQIVNAHNGIFDVDALFRNSERCLICDDTGFLRYFKRHQEYDNAIEYMANCVCTAGKKYIFNPDASKHCKGLHRNVNVREVFMPEEIQEFIEKNRTKDRTLKPMPEWIKQLYRELLAKR